ncbi:hypothetical protein L2E82_25137 [Cichorium intybus]|uniref:Uncharacterized protein n=1 Tax=Cichorium intybus TaxID=13427 RepID=A0ACB9E2R8_CICIN|nr:hypothetical protein L2E82_25137 [Cichorium intybus]
MELNMYSLIDVKVSPKLRTCQGALHIHGLIGDHGVGGEGVVVGGEDGVDVGGVDSVGGEGVVVGGEYGVGVGGVDSVGGEGVVVRDEYGVGVGGGEGVVVGGEYGVGVGGVDSVGGEGVGGSISGGDGAVSPIQIGLHD